MPAMQRLHAQLAGPDFELVAVSVDTKREDVDAYRTRLGCTFRSRSTRRSGSPKPTRAIAIRSRI